MVKVDGSRFRALAAQFAAHVVPMASSVIVKAKAADVAFMPRLKIFAEPAVESIQSAILGETETGHWAEGAETMDPIHEETRFVPMPEFDHLPMRF